jgi:hypothetical protein
MSGRLDLNRLCLRWMSEPTKQRCGDEVGPASSTHVKRLDQSLKLMIIRQDSISNTGLASVGQ